MKKRFNLNLIAMLLVFAIVITSLVSSTFAWLYNGKLASMTDISALDNSGFRIYQWKYNESQDIWNCTNTDVDGSAEYDENNQFMIFDNANLSMPEIHSFAYEPEYAIYYCLVIPAIYRDNAKLFFEYANYQNDEAQVDQESIDEDSKERRLTFKIFETVETLENNELIVTDQKIKTLESDNTVYLSNKIKELESEKNALLNYDYRISDSAPTFEDLSTESITSLFSDAYTDQIVKSSFYPSINNGIDVHTQSDSQSELYLILKIIPNLTLLGDLYSSLVGYKPPYKFMTSVNIYIQIAKDIVNS